MIRKIFLVIDNSNTIKIKASPIIQVCFRMMKISKYKNLPKVFIQLLSNIHEENNLKKFTLKML